MRVSPPGACGARWAGTACRPKNVLHSSGRAPSRDSARGWRGAGGGGGGITGAGARGGGRRAGLSSQGEDRAPR